MGRSTNSRWLGIVVGAVAVCVLAALVPHYAALQQLRDRPDVAMDAVQPKFNHTGQSAPCIALAAALPDRVYSDQHPAFRESTNSYWSLNACEYRPTCVVKPASTQDVATAVEVLKSQFDVTKDSAAPLRFAVRSGGHSPEAGFSSIDGGIVIDLSLLNQVVVSEGRQSATVGVGARWRDVSSQLDREGLAIVGGRNADVGVGGLVLGGGISFFSPRYGMVCDNVDEYEIVLADGTVAHVTSSQHEDLWRALKGGSGNFGIVTRVTLRVYPTTSIWAGYAYWTGWQRPQVLRAFAEFNQPENFDEYAAGPILANAYVQSLGVSMIATHLAYTKPEPWAPVFKPFKDIWRFWSTFKIQTLSEATRELERMAMPGQRQFQATITVKNDLDTLYALSDVYNQKLEEVRNVKNSIWALVLQPMSAALTSKGSPNVLGFESRGANETLVNVLLCASWSSPKDDELVHRVSRDIIAGSEEAARSRGTIDPYVYLNYAASGQKPIDSYGTANKRFLQAMSRKYDADGFFQRAKQGGFKLDLDESNA